MCELFLCRSSCCVDCSDAADGFGREGGRVCPDVLKVGGEPEVLQAAVGFVVVDVVDFEGGVNGETVADVAIIQMARCLRISVLTPLCRTVVLR